MAASNRFNILVVDSDAGSRMKLKDAAMALTLILSDVSRHLEALTFFLAQERDNAVARRKLGESALRLRKFLTPDVRETYVEAAIVHFEGARLPLSACYRGVSKRIKQRLTAKMARRFADEYIEK